MLPSPRTSLRFIWFILFLKLSLARGLDGGRQGELSLLQRLKTRPLSTPVSPLTPEKQATPWPDTFHALLVGNTTTSLQVVDLWYDWPNGRNANLIQNQLDPSGTLFDIEYNNGSTYYFHPEASDLKCDVIPMGVGILPTDWMKNATYLGTETVDNVACDKWAKADFIIYWADVKTGVPVRWQFVNPFMDMHVIRFTPGATMPESQWQLPGYCFTPKQ